jgi:hypothetical protein
MHPCWYTSFLAEIPQFPKQKKKEPKQKKWTDFPGVPVRQLKTPFHKPAVMK